MSRSLACVVLLVNLFAPAAARAQARAPFQVGVHGGFNFIMGVARWPFGARRGRVEASGRGVGSRDVPEGTREARGGADQKSALALPCVV